MVELVSPQSVTTLEYVRKRYGGARMEFYLASISILLTIFSKVAVELYSLYRLLEIVYGFLPWTVACIVPLVWAILIACCGLKTVIYSNTIHAVLLVIGIVCIARYSLEAFDDYDTLRDNYFEAWPNTTLLHFGVLNDSYKYTNCGIPKARSWNLFRPYFNLELPWPGMVFGITINSLWYFCCDQVIIQSALGARDIVQAKYACIMCAYCKILTIVFLFMPGIVARIRYTDFVACADPDICEKACGSRQGCSDMAFPMLFLDVVPKGYRGLVLASLLACGVASLSSSLNSGSTIFTLNVYRNFRPIMTETELLLVTRVSVITIGILSVLVVPIVKASSLLYDYIHSITASFAPPILAVFLCGMLWERASEDSAFRALLLGLGLAAIRQVWSVPYRDERCGDTSDTPAPQILANFHFLHFSIFVFVLCTAYIAVAGVFSEPINEVHVRTCRMVAEP
ncbi:sodium/glucose cotransporter [Elysia marginata]|uniref:Sodium/glucose cotransporter n=1 Tax=Elysia marginata TaxID=1093978 RepID=A0AAV4J037_9GAST|nr:sodium/glucose cotransporter [Elysia marginata]